MSTLVHRFQKNTKKRMTTFERQLYNTAINMSAKLVKRLLQQQLEPRAPAKKRQRVEIASVDDETKRAHFLEMKLGKGNVISTQSGSSSKALQQIKSPKKKVPSSLKTVIGNSRGSSSTTLAKHQPTFNKRRHAKEKNKNMLARIAKMLELGKINHKK